MRLKKDMDEEEEGRMDVMRQNPGRNRPEDANRGDHKKLFLKEILIIKCKVQSVCCTLDCTGSE